MDPISLNNSSKRDNRLFVGIIVTYVIIGVVSLSMIVGGIYIAIHFLSKIW